MPAIYLSVYLLPFSQLCVTTFRRGAVIRASMQAIRVNQQWEGDPGRLLNLTRTASDVPSSAEVWAKLQPGGAVALLAINTAATGAAIDLSVDLSTEVSLRSPAGSWCTAKPCIVRDIWCDTFKVLDLIVSAYMS